MGNELGKGSCDRIRAGLHVCFQCVTRRGDRRAHLTQEPKSQERDPAPADDDPNALEQASRRSWEDSSLVEDRRRSAGNEEYHYQDACDNGIGRPALPVGIACEAPRQHEAGSGQQAEDDETVDAVDGSMERLGTAPMRTRWVAQTRVGHEEAEQEWSPDGAPTRPEDLPEPNREAKREQPTDKKVGDLHPSLVTKAERTHVVAPRAVAGASGALNQEYKYEQERADRAARDQERGYWALAQRMVFFNLHGRILLFRRPVSSVLRHLLSG